MSVPPDARMMLSAPLDPVQLQVFAALAARTRPGRLEPWPSTSDTRTVAYLTPTGALTGITVEDAYAAFRSLQKAGLAVAYPANPRAQRLAAGYRLAAAAGQGRPE